LRYPAALNGPQFLTASFLRPLVVEKGEIVVPAGPGLGVEVDEERIRSGGHSANRLVNGDGGRGVAESPFGFREVTPESLELSERGKPVVRLQPRPDAESRGSGGPVLAAAICIRFTIGRDNRHGRLPERPLPPSRHFLTWPIVIVDGVKHDAWLIQG
jgi:hypothetical protein